MSQKKLGKPLTVSPRYEDFIKSRDRVLESILRKYQRAIDRAVDHLKEMVTLRVSHAHMGSRDLHMLKLSLSKLEHSLDRDFDQVERDVSALLYRMRGTIYGLSQLGHSEAMVRALGKDQKIELSRAAMDRVSSKQMRAGGPIEHRAWLSFEKLKRKVVDAYQRGILFDETTDDIVGRVLEAFPKAKKFKRAPKPLKHPELRESDDQDGGDTAFALSKKKGVVTGQLEPELWEQMVDDYKRDEIPFYSNREPQDEEAYYEEHGMYEWEVEQEATQEFVDQVRNGEIDSANENGIVDFVWIAVIDSKTDECCIVRDGLTVTEIEEGLESGEIDEDECDATTPPGHFFCRCRLAPLTDDMPEKAPPDNGDFESWLSSKT